MKDLSLAELARIGSGLRNALTVVHLRTAQLQRDRKLSYSHRMAIEAVLRATQLSWTALEEVLSSLGLEEVPEARAP